MSVLWIPGSVPKIEELPDEELKRRLSFMTPIKTCDDKQIRPLMTQSVDFWRTAFMWDPLLGDPLDLSKIELWDMARIETYHTCGYIALFKPSLGEVLSQIPEHLVDDVTHFETLMDDNVVGCYSNGDGHRTVTVLYSTFSMEERISRSIARARARSNSTNKELA